MLVVAKFLHIFGLMLGAGAGLGSMAVARQIRQAAGEPSPQLMALRPYFARMALIGIVLIWLTGLWLYIVGYQGAPLGPAFHAKLTAAALLLGVVVAINVVTARARSAGTPPPAWLPRLNMTTPILLLLAVGLAVYVFK